MRVERTALLPASAEEVWRALTEPDGLTAWFGAEASFDRLAPGARVEFRFDDGVVRAAVLEDVEPNRMLSFRWLPFDRAADGTPRPLVATRVEIALIERDGATLLEVVETAPELDRPAGAGARP